MELLQRVFDQSSLKARDIPRIKGVQLVGTVDINRQTNEHSWSDELYDFLGLKPGEVEPSHELFLSYVIDEDQPQLITTIDERINGLNHDKYDLFKILTGA